MVRPANTRSRLKELDGIQQRGWILPERCGKRMKKSIPHPKQCKSLLESIVALSMYSSQGGGRESFPFVVALPIGHPRIIYPNNKILGTSASLLVTSALLVVTRSYYIEGGHCILLHGLPIRPVHVTALGSMLASGPKKLRLTNMEDRTLNSDSPPFVKDWCLPWEGHFRVIFHFHGT